MSKEEKIEILKRIIENFKSHIEEYEDLLLDVDLFRQLTYQLSIFERELKLLLLPQRTIDTLEVGDYVEITDIEDWTDKAIVEDVEEDGFVILNGWGIWGINRNNNEEWMKDIKIIPREAIELLKDLYQKQNT